MWGQNILRPVSIEVPVTLGVVLRLKLHDVQKVGDLCRQKLTVLEPDFCGRAFEMHEHPAASIKAIACSAGVCLLCRRRKSFRVRKVRETEEHEKACKRNARNVPKHCRFSG